MSSTSQDRRIGELEHELAIATSENERLRQHVSRLELRLDLGAPRGMVTEISDDHFVMPSDHQMRRLFDIVVAKHPALTTADFEQTSAAFLALGYVRRSNTLDTSRFNGSWTGLCEDWLRQHGRNTTIYVNAFLCAVICHHDIPFCCADFQALTGVGFGLVYLGHAVGSYPARDAWKKLLDGSGAVREPIRMPGLAQNPNAVGLFAQRGVG